uniref:Ig-like domain-containing protein n=1 Tax=Lates calcarifer TaxID=8187 RepID=A0A4W6FAI1_LATCA
HITKTELSDTAFYYCEKHVELRTTFLNIIFLRVKEPKPDITTIVQDISSDPVRPGDSVTLQCSVLSVSEKKTCPGDYSVYWFRSGSDESHPSVIYTQRNSGSECEKSAEAHSQKCVYNFSRNIVSSSDSGTYYCAVATCGEILFGNGTKLDIEGNQLIFILNHFTRRQVKSLKISIKQIFIVLPRGNIKHKCNHILFLLMNMWCLFLFLMF